MKKIYLLATILVIVVTANAQFTKGQKLFGPSLSLSTNKSTTNDPQRISTYGYTKGTDLSLGISLSSIKMTTPRKGFGVGIGYNIMQYNYDYVQPNSYTGKTTIHNFSATVFERTFVPIKGKFNFYYDAGGSVGVGFGKYNYGSPINTYQKNTNYTAQLYLVPGFTYQLKKKLLLDAALSNFLAARYSLSKYSDNSTSQRSSQNSSFNITSILASGNILQSISFSLRWIL